MATKVETSYLSQIPYCSLNQWFGIREQRGFSNSYRLTHFQNFQTIVLNGIEWRDGLTNFYDACFYFLSLTLAYDAEDIRREEKYQ